MLIYKSTHVEALDAAYAADVGQLNQDFADQANSLLQEGGAAQATESISGQPIGNQPGQGFAAFQATNGTAVDEIVRRGYLKALELATELNKPIETFWINGASSEFELQVCEGLHAIVVFFLIPDAGPNGTFGSINASSKSWVIHATGTGRLQEGAPEGEIFPGDPEVRVEQSSGAGGFTLA